MNTYQESGLQRVLMFTAFGLIIFGARMHIIDVFAVYMPYWDDWNTGTLVYNHVTKGLAVSDVTFGANLHRQVFGRILALTMFELNHRQWDPIVMMIANSATWTVAGLLLIHIAIQSYREINPTPIILLILVLWTYPISLVNTLWGTQSHVYFMTLFAILGCWYVTNPAFSPKWIFGVLCLFAGGLTLAGGSFIGVPVATVYLIYAWVDASNRRSHVYTFIAATLAVTFGVFLIAIQERSGVNMARIEIADLLLTVSKTMSWPIRTKIWPFLIFAIPIFVLIKNLLANNTKQSKLVPFILSIYGFIFIMAFAIASARPSGGTGPARRYADFLALAFIVSSFALLFIQNKKFSLPKIPNQLLVVAWLILIVVAIPYRLDVLRFTLDDRANIIPDQIENVRQFINSNDISWLRNKNFRHIPHHSPDFLATSLTKFQAANILPYQLQRPPRITQSASQGDEPAFVYHGLYSASDNKAGGSLYGEAVIGSYDINGQGNKMTGKFVSEPFYLNRNYAMIPITGYSGFPGMSLKLVNLDNNRESLVKPEERNSVYAETWREVLVPASQGQYQLVAEDLNDQLWFGFAAPRSVGRLSYWVQRWLPHSQWLWFSGLCLIIFSYRKELVLSFQAKVND